MRPAAARSVSRLLLPVVVLVLPAAPLAMADPRETGLAATNLIEAQSGNTPFTTPENRFGFYEQLNLDLTRGSFRAGLRFEADHNSENQFTYDTITQRFAEWADRGLRVRAGTFYAILGRGLVHRSFELPGIVLDQPGLRSRYAPSRDVDGVLLQGAAGPVSGLAFSGSPNGGEFSPGLEDEGFDRYQGQVSGLELDGRLPRNARVGVCYARSTGDGTLQQEFGSGFIDVDVLDTFGNGFASLPVYVEYARRDATFGEWWDFAVADSVPHALYAGMNFLRGPFTLSAEWKDYSDFRLGTNDPPSLVREHPWTLLNRATHVLNATLEQGYQLEGSWSLGRVGDVTVNRSRSDGRFATGPVRFEETYLEAHAMPDRAPGWEATVFFDMGKDEFSFVSRRRVGGGSLRVPLPSGLSAILDVERQAATRATDRFTDHFGSLGVSRAGLGTVAVSWERSTDPEQEDPEKALAPPVDPRNFVSATLSAPLSGRHDMILFVGERRGGRACTAGTCYEVLPFKGVELRLTSRL